MELNDGSSTDVKIVEPEIVDGAEYADMIIENKILEPVELQKSLIPEA